MRDSLKAVGFLLVLLLVCACAPDAAEEMAADESLPPLAFPANLPESVQDCASCHRAIVESYLGHGMSQSLGSADRPPEGQVFNPRNGFQYSLQREADSTWLITRRPEEPPLRQQVVGRIGAGIYDTSWITAEVDASRRPSGRLFFAPVESLRASGLQLSPFDLHQGSPGPFMSLTADCLTCHSDTPPSDLPQAASRPAGDNLFPSNKLGAGAFRHLRSLGCRACHGDAGRHLDLMEGRLKSDRRDIGIVKLGSLTPGAQRDGCARCHLQGDHRIELAQPAVPPLDAAGEETPLAARIVSLVPQRPVADHRFVGQLERLVLSACFQSSAMTCTTCHRPHQSVTSQGAGSFESACLKCHRNPPAQTAWDGAGCSRPAELTVQQVTRLAQRSPNGCLDCHLRRSQPFDLPHVQTVDHWIRRSIPPPQFQIPHRHQADPKGPLAIFDDGRLSQYLSGPDGHLWQQGLIALGLASQGRLEEAAGLFQGFPPPGTPEARQPTAPGPLTGLQSAPLFHHVRGLVLQSQGHLALAVAAYSDALRLDPHRAAARAARARLYFDAGELTSAMSDADVLARDFPDSQVPWILRARTAERLGRPDLAQRAWEEASRRAPSQIRPLGLEND